MIKLSELTGRPVVDLEHGRKLGQVDDVVLDIRTGALVGLIVTSGPAVLGRREEWLIAAARIHALGRDAAIVRGGVGQDRPTGPLPRFGDVRGFKVATDAGQVLGSLADAELDPDSGRIARYLLGRGLISRLLPGQADPVSAELPGVTELRLGQDLILVAAGAVPASEARADAPPVVPDEGAAVPGAVPPAGRERRSAARAPARIRRSAARAPARTALPSEADAERDYQEAQRRLRRAREGPGQS